MSLRRWIVLLVLATLGVIAIFSFLRSAPPEVPFGKVSREDLVSTLITNGQVEPRQSAEIRSAGSGRVATILVKQGDPLRAGEPLLQFDAGEAQARIHDAEATLRSAEARLRQLRAGGPPKARAELDASIEAARLEQRAAKREAEALGRLVERKAATPEELRRQEAEVARLQARIEGLERQRGTMVSPADSAEAQSAVELARTALGEARRIAGQRTVHSPIGGVLCEFAVQPGAWLNSGTRWAGLGSPHGAALRVRGRTGAGQAAIGSLSPSAGTQSRAGNGPEGEPVHRVQAFGTRQVGK